MLLRSAFWLTMGFMVMAPHDTDFGAIATQAKNQAIGVGTQAAEQIIVSQVATNANLATAVLHKLTPPLSVAQLSAPGLPAPVFVFPRPRPAALS